MSWSNVLGTFVHFRLTIFSQKRIGTYDDLCPLKFEPQDVFQMPLSKDS